MAICVLVTLSASPAAAEEPTVAGVWGAVRSNYRSTPVIERLRVSVRTADGPIVRQALSVRTEPESQADDTRRLWVRAGVLKVEMSESESGGRVRVALERANSPWTELDGDNALTLLRRAVPPLPVPHADLAFAPSDSNVEAQEHAEQVQGIAALTPYARGVAWDRVRVERRSSAAPITGTPVTLIGRHDAGMIELLAEAETGKMRRLVITRSDSSGQPHELTIEISPSTEPASAFEIDAEPDRRRADVASVVLEGRSIARPETRFDFARAVDLEGLPMAQPVHTADGRPTLRACVVAAVAWDGPSGIAGGSGAERADGARRWLRAVRSAMGEWGGDTDRHDAAALVVLARLNSNLIASAETDVGRAEAQRLRSLARDALPDAVVATGWHRDRDWPDWARSDSAPLIVVIVDAQGRAVGVVPSSWGAGDFAEVRREVREALSELLSGVEPQPDP